jgi:hypothetical protein
MTIRIVMRLVGKRARIMRERCGGAKFDGIPRRPARTPAALSAGNGFIGAHSALQWRSFRHRRGNAKPG